MVYANLAHKASEPHRPVPTLWLTIGLTIRKEGTRLRNATLVNRMPLRTGFSGTTFQLGPSVQLLSGVLHLNAVIDMFIFAVAIAVYNI
jgi:hypothetical protein